MALEKKKMSEAFEHSNPFPGLRPFEMDESHLFFGRDGLSSQLLEKLMRTRFATVVGSSGSGKSSLVRAGLLPLVLGGLSPAHGRGWRVAIMRPGTRPIHNLAHALGAPIQTVSKDEEQTAIDAGMTEAILNRSSLGLRIYARETIARTDENLLVVVDQFEELFRLTVSGEKNDDRDQADAFVKLLLEAGRQDDLPIYILLTMRSDYLGECDAFFDLPEALNEGQYLIPRMSRDQYRAAISGPIRMSGAAIEPRLINRLLNDVGGDSWQLPIFQHALRRTWDRWLQDGRPDAPIDLPHYLEVGGMAGALSQQADEAYDELPDERSREIAEKIFKALTETTNDNRVVRRPSELQELRAITGAKVKDVVAVLESFRREGRSFLTPPASVPLNRHSIIDISHESLILHWRRLKAWVEEENESRRMYLRLNESAELYRENRTSLLSELELMSALAWRNRERPNEAWARRYAPDYERVTAYLEESNNAYERARYEAEKRQRREITRSRSFSLVLLLGFLISLASTVYAFSQQREASRQRMIAEERRLEAVRQTEIAERKTKEAVDAQEKLKQLSEDTRMQLEAERARRASKR